MKYCRVRNKIYRVREKIQEMEGLMGRDGWMNVQRDGRMERCMNGGWINGWLKAWMDDRWLDVQVGGLSQASTVSTLPMQPPLSVQDVDGWMNG